MKTAIPVILLLSLCAPSGAETRPDNIAGPGWHNASRREGPLPIIRAGRDKLKKPPKSSAETKSAAEPGGIAPAMAGAGGGNFADEATPEIQSLARGLENDPARIFAFVRDRIDYEQYFGCKKGAYLTLLEGRGNDFDQSALLVSLLRAAGYSAQYRFGFHWVPIAGDGGTNLMAWLGLLTNDFDHAANFIVNRGAPAIGVDPNDDTGLAFQRVWVEVSVGGNTYPLDPSFKTYATEAGTSILTAAGLTRSGLLSLAGGTTTADSVQNLSESALGAELVRGTSNLVAWIESQAPNATPVEVLGGRRLLPSAGADLSGGAPPFGDFYVGGFDVETWDAIPTNWMSSLRVVLPGMDRKFFFPELQARRLSVSFAGTTAKLWLDDEWVGTGTVSTASFQMTNVIDHAHGRYSGGQFIDEGWEDQEGGMACKRDDAYVCVILYDFNPGGLRLRRRQEKLDEYLRSGLADSSREVRSETLYVMGLNWLLQTELCNRILSKQRDVSYVNHHRVGRMAQEGGYYVDVPFALTGMLPADGNWGRYGEAFEMTGYLDSGFEHGVIEQMQGGANSAASTIKLLQLANAGGAKIFRATSANYASVVRPQLSNYTTAVMDKIAAELGAAGSAALLPANGQITLGQWRGTGYVISKPDSIGMIISGDYYGGYNWYQGNVASLPVQQWSNNETTYASLGNTTMFETPSFQFNAPPTFSWEPVDMASGAYVYDKTELSIDADTQRPLAFARHYNSNRRNLDPAALGYGWTHNWDIRATKRSDIKAGLGETTPAEMAPALVATAAALEVFSGSSTAKEWAVAALIARWGVDALKENAVSVTMGKDAVQFVRLPDGRFLRPQGLTHTLAKVSNHYELYERHGRTFKFLDDGKLSEIVNPSGQKVTCAYNNGVLSQVQKQIPDTDPALVFTYSNGRLASVAARARLLNNNNQMDRTLSFAQSASNLVSVTDPDGNAWSYTYDGERRMTSLRDPASRLIITNFYDTEGRVVEQWGEGDPDKRWQLFYAGYSSAEVDPEGGTKRYFYDDMGRAVGAEDALGNLSTLAYDGQGHLVAQTSPLGETTSRTYDANHNVILVTDPAGNTVSNAYDAAHHLVETWDARGNRTRYAWTAKHQLASVTDPLNNVTAFGYDSSGNLISVTNAAGLVTRLTPDGAGRHLVTTVTHPDNTTEQFTYNQWGQRLSSVDGRNNTTTFAYNNRGMLTRTAAPLSATVSNAYDSSGNLAATIDPRGYATTRAYSPTAKLLSTTLPAIPAGTPAVENTYDLRDWLTETRDPMDHATAFGHDAAGRVVAATDPLNRTVRTGFDASGRPIAITNALGHVTRTFYDERGLAVEVRDALNQSIRSRFDANGNQVALTNRLANGWSFAFDGNNRLLSTTSPLGRTWRQTYNSRGLVATVTEPSTQSATLLYNSRGWLSSRADSLGTVTNTFDANGNVLTVKEGAATITRQYDALNRVTNYINAAGASIRYTYDAASNLTSLRYPDGKTVTYAYDAHNRLSSVTDWASRVTSFTYDLNGRLTRMDRPNGTRRELSYDGAGQIREIAEKKANGRLIALFRLDYDAGGRPSYEFTVPKPQTWALPELDATADADNRLAAVNGQSVTHDADGNMTAGFLAQGTNAAMLAASFGYDARNRLTTVSVGSTNVSYAYDAEGHRTRMAVNSLTNSYTINPHAPLSQVLVAEASGAQTLYVHGAGLLYAVQPSGAVRYYHYDLRGSTVAMSDESGTVTDRFEYSPYGTLTRREGTTQTPFGYNGAFGVMTDASGLLHMRARFYNPALRRFVNQDPIGFAGGMNWYAYVNGNPVNLTDPFGLSGLDSAFGVLRVVGGGFETAAGYGLAAAAGTFGVATSPTVGGAVVGAAGVVGGVAIAAHGIDQIQAGVRQTLSGQHVESLTSKTLQSAGMSPYAANLADAGISVVGSFGSGFAATGYRAATLAATASPEVASASLLTQIKYYEVGQTSFESATFNANYSRIVNTLDRGATILDDYGSIWGVWRAGSQTFGIAEGTLKYLPTPMANGALGSGFGLLGAGVPSAAGMK